MARLPAALRREQIVETLLAIAEERPGLSVSTQEIADRLGLSQAAVFRHFPAKADIWRALLAWISERLAELAALAADEADAWVGLEKLFLAHAGFIDRFPAVPRIVFSELIHADDPALRAEVQRMVGGYQKRVAKLVAEGRAQGRVDAIVADETAAAFFISLIQGLALRRSLSGESSSTLAPIFFTLFRRSLERKTV